MSKDYRSVIDWSIPIGYLLLGNDWHSHAMRVTSKKDIRRARLRELLETEFKGSQAAFEAATGIAASLVSRYLSGAKGIGEDMAARIEAGAKLPTGWMDHLTKTAVSRASIGIPVVGSAKLGDDGHFVDLEYPVGHGDGYINLPSDDTNAYAVRCVGDSMTPRIQDGEFVVVEPNHAIVNGDEVLVKATDGRVMVKKFLYRRDGKVHLLSVNVAHPPIAIEEKKIEAMHYVEAIVKPSRWVKG